tara:strand:- start:139 stop:693 length:555 start_codon:yes stop_codon:yes gene_type:complete
MNIIDIIKDLKSKEREKKEFTKAYNEVNYKLILATSFKYKDTKFDSSNMNTTIKNQLSKEFVAGGYVAKDKAEPTKLAQAKIDRLSRIYSSKKIQELLKTAKSVEGVSKIYVENKIASQGKLLKFVSGNKFVDYLELANKAFDNLVQHSDDETQEFIITINAQAKKMGFVQTQQDLDEIDEKRA